MFFTLALRAVLSLVNACAAVKTALIAIAATCKARSTPVGTKHFILIQQVHCNITTRNLYAGLVHQYAILQLYTPEDLLAGMNVGFRVLQQGGILIPGFEQCQLREEINAPPEPFEEPTYCKRFHLEVEFRVFFEAEPNSLKPRRAKAPRHIEFASTETNTQVLEEVQQAHWEPIGGINLHERIAFYQTRVNNGESHFHQQKDVPVGPDYVKHHLFETAYQWNLWNQEHERDPQGVDERLDRDPQLKERVFNFRDVAEEYRSKFPHDF
ncbi:hypothetical protein BU25DRAFT_422807 [Macroventuria anomochaeta]|uniref:Uncharacterized protein n=1 Tax=Macroventuria anomochaeta TaxID=301207 RepID=A0ACB6RWU3_9PLEO|nr:uncharacterized protein BU25DRAFT_422807 [Macroventuria anomochaeta]KAF2626253.1 hypothetical protein BU25DRAFT_422807 [Macroventuria anomochaeta]